MLLLRLLTSEKALILGIFVEIPYLKEQGNFTGEQGIDASEQGMFPENREPPLDSPDRRTERRLIGKERQS
jgi:hypothetical protein